MKTLLCNGTIIDGTGAREFRGDVLFNREKILAIFRENSEDAKKIRENFDGEKIDARDCIIAPGFIDAHAHSDAYLILEPDAPSKLAQGITTEINGQCGGSIAPRFGEARLSSDWASLLGARLTWHTLGDYREILNREKSAINTIQFIGHNTLRASVVGYAGRAATTDELAKMSRLLEQALDEGGWGLTTGLIYQPGKYATQNEVEILAKIAARKNALYATHMRSEGDALLESIDEVIALARATGIRAEISHLKTSGEKNWHKLPQALAKIEDAMREGVLLGADRYPFCAAGTDLDVVFPDWAGEGGTPAECTRLASHEIREKIIAELNASTRDWASVMIGGVWHDDNREFSGRTIREILAMKNFAKTPGECVCKILEKDACRTGAFFFGMSEKNLDTLLATPWIVPGSDASLRAPWGPLGADHPHPRAYGTMPEFYRRARAVGVSREEAIHRMTLMPCERFGIARRGKICADAIADLVVFREKDFANRATYAAPHQFATGVEGVWVAGERVFANGRATGARPGRLLTREACGR